MAGVVTLLRNLLDKRSDQTIVFLFCPDDFFLV
jgi:hypothetical protein